MLNDKYIYVFVRQDLTITQQLVHTNHAVYEMAKKYLETDLEYEELEHVPALIVIGTPNEKTLMGVFNKLRDNNIDFCPWGDDEHPELGDLLAIATVPLDLDQKQVLKDYRLYKPRFDIEDQGLGSSLT